MQEGLKSSDRTITRAAFRGNTEATEELRARAFHAKKSAIAQRRDAVIGEKQHAKEAAAEAEFYEARQEALERAVSDIRAE